jgi:hypothetical protein
MWGDFHSSCCRWLCCPQSATALQTPQRDHDGEREDEYDSNDFITPSARSDAEDGEWVEDAHDALRGDPTGQVGDIIGHVMVCLQQGSRITLARVLGAHMDERGLACLAMEESLHEGCTILTHRDCL